MTKDEYPNLLPMHRKRCFADIARAVVADDHPLFREALSSLLGNLLPAVDLLHADRMEEVFDYANRDAPPSLFLLDLLFPSMDVAVSLPQLRRRCPRASIIVVSMLDDPQVVAQVMRAGADGFINKSVSNERCVKAIERILEGEYVIELEAAAPDPDYGAGISLTDRQHAVLTQLALRLSNKEIARNLDLSPFTVRAHISTLMRLLGVARRSKLVEKASSLRLIEID